MSYEVYIDVEHHDRHYSGDNPGKESTAYKLTDGPQPLEHVANALHMFADEIDPRFVRTERDVAEAEWDRYWVRVMRTERNQAHADLSLALEALREIVRDANQSRPMESLNRVSTRARAVLDQLEEGERSQ